VTPPDVIPDARPDIRPDARPTHHLARPDVVSLFWGRGARSFGVYRGTEVNPRRLIAVFTYFGGAIPVMSVHCDPWEYLALEVDYSLMGLDLVPGKDMILSWDPEYGRWEDLGD
jgi:hypothetical protein